MGKCKRGNNRLQAEERASPAKSAGKRNRENSMGYKRPHVNYEKKKSGKMQLEARAMKLVLQQPLRTVERLKRNAFGAGQRKDEKH